MVRMFYERLSYKRVNITPDYNLYIGLAEDADSVFGPEFIPDRMNYHLVVRKVTGIPFVETFVVQWFEEVIESRSSIIRQAVQVANIPTGRHVGDDQSMKRLMLDEIIDDDEPNEDSYSLVHGSHGYDEEDVDIDASTEEVAMQVAQKSAYASGSSGNMDINAFEESTMDQWDPNTIQRQYRAYKKTIIREKLNAHMKNDFTLFRKADILEKDADRIYKQWEDYYYGEPRSQQQPKLGFKEEWNRISKERLH